MKKLGIIGGMGPLATQLLYKEITVKDIKPIFVNAAKSASNILFLMSTNCRSSLETAALITFPDKQRIRTLQNYIHQNFMEDISLDDVSRFVDISPYYFSKLFKQEEGRNFIEYLTGVRMNAARRLLKDPGYSIKEICGMSGYSDPNYFSRIFKKYEGVTPTEYRERLR